MALKKNAKKAAARWRYLKEDGMAIRWQEAAVEPAVGKVGKGKLVAAIVGLVVLAYAFGFLGGKIFSERSLEEKQLVAGTVEEPKNLLPLPAEKTLAASIDIVAVKELGYVGVVSKAEVEIIPGKGRALFSLNPFVEPDTQESAEIARKVAQDVTGKDLSEKDVIYSITGLDSKTRLVGGPSAGAAMTVATIAAIEGKKVRSDAAITGMIYPDGSVKPVGGIIEKAAAIAQQGKKLFLVPKGEAQLTYYAEQVQEEQQGRFLIRRISYVPKTLDVAKYAMDQWKLEIKEVSSIKEAAGLLLESA